MSGRKMGERHQLLAFLDEYTNLGALRQLILEGCHLQSNDIIRRRAKELNIVLKEPIAPGQKEP